MELHSKRKAVDSANGYYAINASGMSIVTASVVTPAVLKVERVLVCSRQRYHIFLRPLASVAFGASQTLVTLTLRVHVTMDVSDLSAQLTSVPIL